MIKGLRRGLIKYTDLREPDSSVLVSHEIELSEEGDDFVRVYRSKDSFMAAWQKSVEIAGSFFLWNES